MDFIPCPLVNGAVLIHKPGLPQINLVKTDGDRHALNSHHHQKTVQKIQIGFRMSDGKHYQGLVHICHSRTYENVGTGKDGVNIAFLLLLIQNRKLHIVPHKGFDFTVAEHALCLTLVHMVPAVIDIIKACNSFDYLTCHIRLLSHRKKCHRIGLDYC